jgi:hypothetical protein
MKLISCRMSDEGQWFAVRTRAGAEDRAAIGIAKAGLEAYLPVEFARIVYRGAHRGRSEVVWRPVFMGHVFAMLNPARDLPRLREIQGVDAEVRRAGKLVPVSNDVVKALRSSERRGAFDAAIGCRLAVAEDERPDSRFASLMARIKRERGSKKRTALLMELLMAPVSKNPR